MTEEINSRRGVYDYSIFGLHIASELPVPELSPLPAAPARAADVSIHFLPPAELQGGNPGRPLQVDGDEVVLTVDKVARYRIAAGRRISVEPCAAATERNVRLFLLGSALGIICHQRALLPLHATAIVVNGCAVAFAGRAGIGKSTLAAHFLARGYEVLCDDICVTSFDAHGRPVAWPGAPHLKLWRDTAETFGHDCGKLQRVLDELDKYRVPRAGVATAGPFPLAGFYALSDLATVDACADIVPLGGSLALQAIMANTYRKKYLGPMGLANANLRQAAAVAQQVRIFAAPRRRGIEVVRGEAERLEQHVQTMTFQGAVPRRQAG